MWGLWEYWVCKIGRRFLGLCFRGYLGERKVGREGVLGIFRY